MGLFFSCENWNQARVDKSLSRYSRLYLGSSIHEFYLRKVSTANYVVNAIFMLINIAWCIKGGQNIKMTQFLKHITYLHEFKKRISKKICNCTHICKFTAEMGSHKYQLYDMENCKTFLLDFLPISENCLYLMMLLNVETWDCGVKYRF